MHAVADHDGLRLRERKSAERIGNDVRFTGAHFVHRGPGNAAEIGRELKVFKDFFRKKFGFGSGDIQFFPARGERGERFGDPVVDAVFKDPLIRVIFAVKGDGPSGRFFAHAVKSLEGFHEGRPDKGGEFFSVRLRDPAFFQRIENGIRDAVERVGQRPVQVE